MISRQFGTHKANRCPLKYADLAPYLFQLDGLVRVVFELRVGRMGSLGLIPGRANIVSFRTSNECKIRFGEFQLIFGPVPFVFPFAILSHKE